MKKIILSSLLVLVVSFTYAQKAKFGITAGVDFASAKLDFGSGSSTESETGFYVGGLVDIAASDKFHLQPELLFVFIKDSKQLQLPILAKLFLAEKFSVLLGPDLLIDIDGDSAGAKSMGVGFDFGVAYDIDNNFTIEAKYNVGITNLIKDGPAGYSGKINGLFFGLGYKF